MGLIPPGNLVNLDPPRHTHARIRTLGSKTTNLNKTNTNVSDEKPSAEGQASVKHDPKTIPKG